MGSVILPVVGVVLAILTYQLRRSATVTQLRASVTAIEADDKP
jgi:hypothetical protein